MTADRPVADREPLSAECDAVILLDSATCDLRPGHVGDHVFAGRPFEPFDRAAYLDAVRAHPDEAGLRTLRIELEDIRDNGYQPSYNGRPSCPFCANFVDDEETHTPDCALVAALTEPAVPVAGVEEEWLGPEYAAALAEHLGAAQPEDDGLDVERLALALHAAEPVRYAECYHGLTVSDCGIDAEDIAAEYARLSESSEGVERRDGA